MKKEIFLLKTSIAKRVKAIRERLALTQKALANKLGIPVKNLSTVEIGGQFPTIPLIIKFIDMFRISPVWLLKGEGDMFLNDDDPIRNRLEYFKKIFPGVPAEPDVIRMIEGMAVPVMKNAILLESLKLEEVYRSQILDHEKEN